ncbi:SAM hydroxide adenosyltransferase, partial [Micromonospora zhanjiangensis]
AALARRVTVADTPAVRGETFGEVPPGGLVVYGDSADRVAVAVNGGRAAVVLSVTPGDVLRVVDAE